MSQLGLRGKRRHRPELPLVPLIDVLVMLVLFSFVTMRFASNQTLNITLPKVDTAGKNAFQGNLTIGVDKDGKYFVNGKPVPKDKLIALLGQIKDFNRDLPVLVNADEKTPFENVTYVMDMCRKAGLNKVHFQSR